MATNFMRFDEKHTVAGSSKLKATIAGHIFNIRVTSDTLDNGVLVKKGAFEEGTLDVYTQAAPSGSFKGTVIAQAANGNYYVHVDAVDGDLFVLQVPMIYEEYTTRCQHESNFFNVKDDVVRSYELYVGDVFEVSLEAFDAEPTIGGAVSFDDATKKYVAA